MARQARAEATRRKIMAAAVDLFIEHGYAATGLGDIIERAELTKGALYYHFDSRDAVAAAIIEEASAIVLGAMRGITESSAPALENIIHGTFVISDLVATDKIARTGRQLISALGEFNDAAADTYKSWMQLMIAEVAEARVEGDLRADLDVDDVAETIVGAALGAEQLANALSGGADMPRRLTRAWEVLLPAIATEESLPYFREFMARESLRHLGPLPNE
jgi:AcrR family transcriptional regulator